MIDEELDRRLRLALAPRTDAPRVPLDHVTTRTRTLRRRRTHGAAIASAAAVAVVAGFLVPALLGGEQGRDRDTGPAVTPSITSRVTPSPTPAPSMRTTPLPSAERPACGGGQGNGVPPAEAEPVRWLAPSRGTTTRKLAALSREVDQCVPPTTSAWYTPATDGTVARVLTVAIWRDREQAGGEPCDRVDVPGPGSSRGYQAVRVRGTAGRLFPGTVGSCVSWSGPGGSAWRATVMSAGPGDHRARDRAALLPAVESLTVHRDGLDRSRPPAGFARPVPPAGGGVPNRAHLVLDTGPMKSYGWVLRVQVTGDSAPFVPAGARQVEVRGRTGWLSSESGMDDQGRAVMIWVVQDGVVATLSGPGSAESALALARSVVKVPADDPRLSGG